ncbi:high-potential iron-sulfur protein [Castellaniella caeni]
MPKVRHEFDKNRRTLMRNGITAAVIGTVAGSALMKHSPAQAQAAKGSKATMMYQETPHGKDECDNCIHYTPGKTPTADGTCNVVEGSIAPKAWCVAFAPKG